MPPHRISDENKVLVRRFGEALNARRFDILDELVDQGFIRHCQATPEITIRSRDQFKEYLRRDAAVFPDSQQTLQHIVAEGDLVAIWVTYEGTQMGQMGSFPPSEKRMHVDFAAVLRIENGKIAEMWATWDNMAVLAQLGHLSPLHPGRDK